MLFESLLRQMMPAAGARLDPHLSYIVPAMVKGRIDTPDRIAAFLAQLAHESRQYLDLEDIWGPTEAQLGYEGRAYLGNIHPGDGRKYAGVGPLQTTVRRNVTACGIYLGIDAAADPKKLTQPQYATASAVWFWTVGNGQIDLNLLADRGWFTTITRVVNGGRNGLEDRLVRWKRCRAVLGLPGFTSPGDEELRSCSCSATTGLPSAAWRARRPSPA